MERRVVVTGMGAVSPPIPKIPPITASVEEKKGRT